MCIRDRQKIFSGTDIDEYDEAAIHIAAVEKSSEKMAGKERKRLRGYLRSAEDQLD